jgi:hypothetical protein
MLRKVCGQFTVKLLGPLATLRGWARLAAKTRVCAYRWTDQPPCLIRIFIELGLSLRLRAVPTR